MLVSCEGLSSHFSDRILNEKFAGGFIGDFFRLLFRQSIPMICAIIWQINVFLWHLPTLYINNNNKCGRRKHYYRRRKSSETWINCSNKIMNNKFRIWMEYVHVDPIVIVSSLENLQFTLHYPSHTTLCWTSANGITGFERKIVDSDVMRDDILLIESVERVQLAWSKRFGCRPTSYVKRSNLDSRLQRYCTGLRTI